MKMLFFIGIYSKRVRLGYVVDDNVNYGGTLGRVVSSRQMPNPCEICLSLTRLII